MSAPPKSLARAIYDARPKVVAALAVQCRDLDLAEDAFSESAAKCLQQGAAPANVTAWLMTVSKRQIIDTIRQRQAEDRAIEGQARVLEMDRQILAFPEAIEDERLRLIFICCHPAIGMEARVALALKVICGLSVAEIARVFLTSEQTMFKRITRAKQKVAKAGISFELPPRKTWGERLDAVLLTLELAFTAAYQDADGERSTIDGTNAAEEVARLAGLLTKVIPQEPEVLGLAALIHLAKSRLPARVDSTGMMVPLSEQDCALWDYALIEKARIWLDQSAQMGRTGPYQIMALIQLAHAYRGFGRGLEQATQWSDILRLYDALMRLRPGPMVALNRALALAKVSGVDAGLAAIEELDTAQLKTAQSKKAQLEKTRPYHVARADLLSRKGQVKAAIAAYTKALELNPPKAERLFLKAKLEALRETFKPCNGSSHTATAKP